MSREDLYAVVGWAAAESWNPGLDDVPVFHAADRDGFLVGSLDGERVASVSVVNYGPGFAFLGLYICRPEFRGQGHGFALWQAGLAHAGARTIGLDGVVAQQTKYAAQGFVLAHRNVRYGGVVSGAKPVRARVVERMPGDARLDAAIVAYDRPFFGGPRSAFLRAWLSSPTRRTFAWIEDGAVRGYGSIRPSITGHRIGPLFADSETIADGLFQTMAAYRDRSVLFLDVSEPNPDAVRLAIRHGLAPSFETARMYRGPAPALPLDRIYGVTTLELG